jgi:hypothetical protein
LKTPKRGFEYPAIQLRNLWEFAYSLDRADRASIEGSIAACCQYTDPDNLSGWHQLYREH